MNMQAVKRMEIVTSFKAIRTDAGSATLLSGGMAYFSKMEYFSTLYNS